MPRTCRQIDTDQLMQGVDQLEIVHRGVVYRLSITRQGKLILTK
ncbi:MAG: hemin uptake protein HemP [Candidatus Thiodiazotropha sp.]